MAEAAVVAGLNGEPPGGGPGEFDSGPLGSPLDGPINSPLGNMGLPGMIPPGISGAPGSSMLAMGSGFGPGPADMFSGAALGPAFGSMSGPSEINGGLMGPAMGQIGLGTGFNPNDASLNLYGNAQEPVIEFFEDPSLYDDYQKNQPAQLEEASSELVNFIINGPSDFGMVISNFSNSSSLNIKYNFDQPSSSYSVSRSNYYEYDSTTQNLRWDSKPSTSSQTIAETESNGSFGSAQVIVEVVSKLQQTPMLAMILFPVKIQSGWINNGVDLLEVDLQSGETLIVDVDYGDAFSDSLNTYVTLYNSSQNSVAENDDSAINQGGAGSSGTGDSYISYTSTTSESFYIFLEDSPKNNNSNTAGDYVINLSINSNQFFNRTRNFVNIKRWGEQQTSIYF